MRRYLSLAIVLVGLLAGCARPTASGPLVEYRRTGGIAGFDDKLTIMADGSAEVSQRGKTAQFTLDAATAERLTSLFEKGGFASLRGEYLPSSNCCDLFDYQVTYRGKQVHTMDTAVPEQLRPILDELNRIVQERR